MLKKIENESAIIHYSVHGKGKVVVLIHGFGEDSNIWNNQVNFLQNECCLIMPDLPGSGKSIIKNNAASIKGYLPNQLEYYVEIVHTILLAENITTCCMLGHSMGGYITLAYLEKYSSHINSFGFIHSSAYADSAEKKEIRKKGIEVMQQYGAFAFLQKTIPNLFSETYKEANSEKVASLIEAAKTFTTTACCNYYEAMMNRPDRTSVLNSNPLPVLFVCGTEDVAVLLKDVLQQMHLPDCSYIHIIQNCGHMGMWEATEQMNIFLQHFIQETFS